MQIMQLSTKVCNLSQTTNLIGYLYHNITLMTLIFDSKIINSVIYFT